MKRVPCFYCGGNGQEMHGYGGPCSACKGTGSVAVATCKMCKRDPAYPGATYCGEDCYHKDLESKKR